MLAVGLIAQLILFGGTTAMMVQAWWEKDAYNHGFFIVPISVFILWRARHRLVAMAPDPTLWGVAVMAIAAVGWLLGNVAGVLVVEQLSFVLKLQALVLAVVGWRSQAFWVSSQPRRP